MLTLWICELLCDEIIRDYISDLWFLTVNQHNDSSFKKQNTYTKANATRERFAESADLGANKGILKMSIKDGNRP